MSIVVSLQLKNPTATTFELFAEATATSSTPSITDGTGFSAYTSGGTVLTQSLYYQM